MLLSEKPEYSWGLRYQWLLSLSIVASAWELLLIHENGNYTWETTPTNVLIVANIVINIQEKWICWHLTGIHEAVFRKSDKKIFLVNVCTNVMIVIEKYSFKFYLKIHPRIYSGERLNNCYDFGKGFWYKSNLDVHQSLRKKLYTK